MREASGRREKHTAMIEELTKKLQSQLELFTVSIPGGVKISNDDPEYSFKYVSEQFANMLSYATPKELLDASGGNIIGLEGANLTVAKRWTAGGQNVPGETGRLF